MPFYQNKGLIPSKKHTVIKYKSKLCYEELVSREGFSSMYSNLYHLNMPTSINKIGIFNKTELKTSNNTHKPRHVITNKITSQKWNIIIIRIEMIENIYRINLFHI